jgi:hypothetical protein
MKENFKKIQIKGTISITLDKESGKVWTENKATILQAIVKVCEDYDSQGYRMTLRQLYYQLVAKDLIPNHDKVYKKLSGLKDDCVYSGLVDWSIFEDRGRIPRRAYFENDVIGALGRTVDQYKLNRQLDQPKHIEVWTEKDAISDILSRVTNPMTIHLVVNKGYSSSTAMYAAYQRFIRQIENNKKIVILYFGDHDPSGLDMIRDIKERILFFMENGSQKDGLQELMNEWELSEEGQEFIDMHDEDFEYRKFYKDDEGIESSYTDLDKMFFEHHFEIKPIGLTMDQIEEFNPPHNPAKITDPRAKEYVKKFGQKSWEVDALQPAVMTEIVSDAINEDLDQEIYDSTLEIEKKDQNEIKNIIENLK